MSSLPFHLWTAAILKSGSYLEEIEFNVLNLVPQSTYIHITKQSCSLARRTAAAGERGPSRNRRAAARQAQGLHKASAGRAIRSWHVHTREKLSHFHFFLFPVNLLRSDF